MESVFPMKWSWKLAIGLVMALALIAAVLAMLELTGAISRGAALREASDVERYVAIAFCGALQPLGIWVLRLGELQLDSRTIRYLGFAPWPCTRSLELREVVRWGHALVSNRGRRQRHLVFERRGGEISTIKLAMYAGEKRALEALEQRLGAATPAVATFTGLRFADR